jgi:hypothetical protein
MSGRRSSRPGAIAVRGFAFDVVLVLIWRFGWKHSWATSLTYGGVLLTLTCAVTAYAWWWQRHPEIEQRMLAKKQAKRGATAEQRARDAAAAEAATRAAGREPYRR